MVYTVTFDIQSEAKEHFLSRLNSFRPVKLTDSTWLISTQQSIDHVHLTLKFGLTLEDTLLITTVSEYQGQAPKDVSQWLSNFGR